MQRRILLYIVFITISIGLQAQVSGVVKDKVTGNALEGVEVFINNSSWRTITKEDGSFLLEGIYPGFFEFSDVQVFFGEVIDNCQLPVLRKWARRTAN